MNVSPTVINASQNTLLTGSLATRLTMLLTTPIQPPDGSLGGRNVTFKAPTATGGNAGDVEFAKAKLTGVADRVAFIKLKDDPLFPGTMSFTVKYADELQTTASRAGYAPCWFLPWKSKRIVKIKIEDYTTNGTNTVAFQPGGGIAPLPNPDLFFTAAINGCSVYATGSGRTPSLYHGGIEGEMTGKIADVAYNALGGTSEAVWDSLVEGGIYNATGPLQPRGARVATKATKLNYSTVNRSDYVAERDAHGQHLQARDGKLTTSRALEIERSLAGRFGVTEVGVSPWACVFGLRDTTGNWSLYLVKNAMVSYKRLRFTRGEGWRLLTREKDQWATSQVINLGYQQFFPARSVCHYRAISTRTLL